MFCKFTCFCIPKWQATTGAYMLIQACWSMLRIGRVNIYIYSAQFSLKCYIILKVLLRVNSGWAHHMTSIQWDVRDLAHENHHRHGHGRWLCLCWLSGDPLACHWHSKHWPRLLSTTLPPASMDLGHANWQICQNMVTHKELLFARSFCVDATACLDHCSQVDSTCHGLQRNGAPGRSILWIPTASRLFNL